jgi:hypothetical protein
LQEAGSQKDLESLEDPRDLKKVGNLDETLEDKLFFIHFI